MRALKSLVAGVLLLGAATVGSAQANTVQIGVGTADSPLIGTLDVVGAGTISGFSGLPSGTTTLGSIAWSYDLPQNANPTTETDFLNSLIAALAVPGTPTTFTEKQEGAGFGGAEKTFVVDTEWFSLKIDGDQVGTSFYHNDTGGVLTLHYLAGVGTSSNGLSHVTEYGAAVPGPIVGAGLPGLIMACGGLLALARRRRHQMA